VLEALTSDEIEKLGQRMAAEKARLQGRTTVNTSDAKEKDEAAVAKPGIIAKLADFVGLGAKANKQRAKTATKKPKKKVAAKRTGKGQRSVGSATAKKSEVKSKSKNAAKTKAASSKKLSSGSASKAAKKRSSR